ncbi:hypothetical protein C493_09725 [Natronolimnohabitans innermongolicus JCM 12255]|uniref:Uncharacterized protein n=1 Tax=Natronolimnohabitans innermongolicus JCM 12255 TaxID=1227499 RepID=L9X7P3_9EURY|nr:hypothetical protein C493_09725 [Natronolimnohabitans innermongolicus JCM 12255]
MTDDGPEYETDFRAAPDEYEIGRGEEGVLQPPFSVRVRFAHPSRKNLDQKGCLAPMALGSGDQPNP